jgi:hypothetical protein
MIVAVVDPVAGTLNRFECAGGKAKLTHRYAHGGPCVFDLGVVDEMRLMPPQHMSVEPEKPLPPYNAAA